VSFAERELRSIAAGDLAQSLARLRPAAHNDGGALCCGSSAVAWRSLIPKNSESSQHTRLGIVVLVDIPTVARDFGDRLIAAQQRFPRLLRGVDTSGKPTEGIPITATGVTALVFIVGEEFAEAEQLARSSIAPRGFAVRDAGDRRDQHSPGYRPCGAHPIRRALGEKLEPKAGQTRQLGRRNSRHKPGQRPLRPRRRQRRRAAGRDQCCDAGSG
jgi:hypothetical protein